LDLVFPSDEEILEAMTGPDRPWDDLHHRSYFLPEMRRVEEGEFTTTMNRDATCPAKPLATHRIYVEGNMVSIAETIPIDISRTPGIVENVFIGSDCSSKEIQVYTELFKEFCDVFAWSYEEMLGIDPRIVKHEIRTYLNAKLVRQKICPVNPCKAATIKDQVEKLIKASFIYLVQLTKWVLNPIPVNKKIRYDSCVYGLS
jgi:hypothetical protein